MIFCCSSIRTATRHASPNQSHPTKHRRSSRKLSVLTFYHHLPFHSKNKPTDGVYLTSPLWGHIVDARGPRPLLFSGFFLLLAGYSGIRFIFNAGIPPGADTIPTSTFCALVVCKLMTGAGGNCGITSALNTSAKTFPDRAVCLLIGSLIVLVVNFFSVLFIAWTSYGDSSFWIRSLCVLVLCGGTYGGRQRYAFLPQAPRLWYGFSHDFWLFLREAYTAPTYCG